MFGLPFTSNIPSALPIEQVRVRVPKRLIIYPYNIKSKAAKELAYQFDTFVVREDGKYQPQNNDLIVNWGGGRIPRWHREGLNYLNKFDALNIAKNKKSTFLKLKEQGVSIPQFTTSIEEAKAWNGCGSIVICRELLESSSGNGIVIARNSTELVSAPLYVRYIKKKSEYRVHVCRNSIIDFAQKKRALDAERSEESSLIRNKQFGWVFCRENVELPECVKIQAIKAVTALGLDFGAVDIIYNSELRSAFVLEVNTACGLEGKTVESYCTAFETILNE